MKETPTSRRKKQWAQLAIALGARGVTATDLSGISARDLYVQMHGKSSPGGQLPTKRNYFVQSPAHRYQSGLFVGLYQMALKASPTEPGLAVIHAYAYYHAILGGEVDESLSYPSERASKALLSIEQAKYLVECLRDGDVVGGTTASTIKLQSCVLCRSLTIGEAIRVRYRCPACEEAKSKAKAIA